MLKVLAAALAGLWLTLAWSPVEAQTAKAWTVAACGTSPSGFNPAGGGYAAGAAYPIVQDINGLGCTNASVTISGTSQVSGPTANGSPASTPPVLIGGTVDGTANGNVENAKVDTGGLVHVSVDSTTGANTAITAPLGTQTLAASVAVTIGNGVDVSEGPVGATHSCAGSDTVLGCIGQVDDDIKGSTPAGTAIIGKVGIDQTTPGTTNGTQDAATSATGAAVSAKAIYQGAQASAVLKGMTSCDTHAFYDASDNGKKTVVAGVSAKKIYVCGFIMGTGGTATNLSLTSGTGTDCVTTSTAITPAYQLIANAQVGANAAYWNGLVTLANADNLCVNASAGNAHQVEVWYTIQP